MSDLDYEFDPETGEIIIYQPMFHNPSETFGVRISADDFKVNSKATAEWLLKKLLDYDAELEAVKLKRKAINDNLDYKKESLESARAKLLERFEHQLQDYATEVLKDGKKKSVILDYGKIGFRENPGSLVIKDEEAAKQWLVTHNCMDAIKVKSSILVSKIPDDLLLPVEAFEKIPPYTKFYIDTGVK